MDNKLATWISSELETRGWSARELGRRSGYTGAYISRIISGEQSGSFDFVAKIAPVFGKTPEDGFRQAGLLSPQPGSIQEEEKLLSVFRHLAPAHQKLLVEMLHGLPEQSPVIRESAGKYRLPAVPPVPGDEDIMELLKRLDPYHQRTVYDFARWTLEQQANPYDSDFKRQKEAERRYNIGIAALIEAVYQLPVTEYQKVLNFLLALKADPETFGAIIESLRTSPTE